MKLKTLIITSALSLSLLTSTVFATGAEDFTDIQGHWAYDSIETAIELGLFQGTSDTTFEPNKTMTRAEFVTVVMRTVAPEYSLADGEYWWTGSYEAAMDLGIITVSTWDAEDMEADVTREVMGYLLGNALKYTGEELDANISATRIPDYRHINNFYATNVLTAYSNGLLVGTDTEGTFNPDGTMSRATACIVLSRLVVADNREDVMTDTEYYAEQAAAQAVVNSSALAQVGDVVVNSAGQSVTLAIGPSGVLGEGQGVAADLGITYEKYGQTFTVEHNSAVILDGATDSLGNFINNQYYWVNSLTGEGHWSMEWASIRENTMPSYDTVGFAYELTDDMNFYYEPYSKQWTPLYSSNQTDALMAAINSANGL